MIEEFRKRVAARHDIAGAWKQSGGRVAGWVCTYAPEEILLAAGMLPVRVFGGDREATPLGDAYLYTNLCSYVRACADAGLDGEYAYLDCFVATNACDSIRRLFDVWHHYVSTPLAVVVSVPVRSAPVNVAFFRSELERVRREVGEVVGAPISDDALADAIRTLNRTRSLLAQLYELRRADTPPVTGAETLAVVLAALVTPKDEYNRLLARFLATLEEGGRGAGYGRHRPVRLFLMGSELDKPEYVEIIEGLGALVVGDDLCNGARYFSDPVMEEGDPMAALAERYLRRLPCPRMEPPRRRVETVLSLVRQQRAEGVVYAELQFCHLHGGTYPGVRDALMAAGVPVLKVEREYVASGAGQMKTRVQAFLERIRAGI